MKNYVIEETFYYEDLKCVVTFNRLGHRCGYVGVKKTHCLYGKHYDSIPDFYVHGGITYADDMHPYNDARWYFGFDCAHSGDKKDFESAKKYFGDDELVLKMIMIEENMDKTWKSPLISTLRTKQYVRKECLSLARQLVAFRIKYEACKEKELQNLEHKGDWDEKEKNR